ncbi:MAG: tol-pal system protein YbgF [Gammaproteobacteria bacterium]|nr:tol-pal system protein YbgF [Gammaproteobacteria bacterium]
MKVRHALLSGVLIPAICVVISMPLFVSAAPSPVPVESRESVVSYQPPIEEVAPGGMENQYQQQLLQQEVMELRGLVERLQHELGRLKSTQDDRYLELDARLQQVLKANVQVPEPVAEDPEETVLAVIDENLSEKDLYETTQILIRNRQYEMAITQLEALIDRFPDGEYTANTYYWLGQVQAAKTNPDFEKARQALAQVISYFPDHSKVPDAAYALGKVYYTLGDCERATDLLQQVVDQYPGKSAAKLAGNYLRESVNCDN